MTDAKRDLIESYEKDETVDPTELARCALANLGNLYAQVEWLAKVPQAMVVEAQLRGVIAACERRDQRIAEVNQALKELETELEPK